MTPTPVKKKMAAQVETTFKVPVAAAVAAAAGRSAADSSLKIIVVRGAQQLAEHVAAWDDLAAAALEPNVFYEAWYLLPALRAFGGGLDVRFVLIYAQAGDHAPPLLCGLFPLERHKRYKGLPVRTMGLWQHLYCSLCTPLLRAGRERECLEALFDWLATDTDGAALLEMTRVPAAGPFQEAWVEFCRARGILTAIDESYTRALFRPASDGETYVRGALSSKRRKELKRQENRLAELGRIEYSALDNEADLPRWLEEFLRLEAGGWKGREGTAFASHDADCAFFRAVVEEAFRRRRLMMLALRVDGRAIAMKFNLLASGGAFACKIAFDEEYARFSPGALLELDNIHRLHLLPHIHWMDSCAIPDHFMINRLWTERRLMQDLVAATGRRPGDLVVSSLPLLRWLKRQKRRRGARRDSSKLREDAA